MGWLWVASLSLASVAVPPLSGRVVDLAGLLPPAERVAIESRLEALERQTSVQVVVATVPALGGEPIERFSLRLAEAWRIGQKGLDNGVIVVVARDERKVRIEVGYGLESAIPDALANRIIQERIVPRFRAGDYAGGLVGAVDGLALAARRQYPAAPLPVALRPPLWMRLPELLPTLFAAVFGWFLLFGFTYDAVGIKSPLTSAVPAAIGIGLWGPSTGLLVGPWQLLWPVVGFLMGLAAYPMGEHLSRASRYGGGGGSTWSSGGSGWSGGSSSSSGSSFSSGSGGGFSGGGGRFGGGGASGNW